MPQHTAAAYLNNGLHAEPQAAWVSVFSHSYAVNWVVMRLKIDSNIYSIILKVTHLSDKIVDALRQVVADTYALIGQTHICHWNVRGPSFFSLHIAFEEQYTELFAAVDEIAERIRAKGALAPGGLSNLAEIAGINEIAENASAKEMVEHLVSANSKLLTDLKTARDFAGDDGDSETEDLMIARIQVHEKTLWMLKSFLE
jgi:starvation-inducible DNA-binding protein